jgi:hypothetical protein
MCRTAVQAVPSARLLALAWSGVVTTVGSKTTHCSNATMMAVVPIGVAAIVVWRNTAGEPFDAEKCLDPYNNIPHKEVSFKPVPMDILETSMQE